jgi:hypothetical protein
LRNLHTVFHRGFAFPPTVTKGPFSPTPSTAFLTVCVRDDSHSHSDYGEVKSLCCFDLHFL